MNITGFGVRPDNADIVRQPAHRGGCRRADPAAPWLPAPAPAPGGRGGDRCWSRARPISPRLGAHRPTGPDTGQSLGWPSCCFWPGWRSTCVRCAVVPYASPFGAIGSHSCLAQRSAQDLGQWAGPGRRSSSLSRCQRPRSDLWYRYSKTPGRRTASSAKPSSPRLPWRTSLPSCC
jgi:hypothetical protein